jgi:hypothetical protein
MKTILGPVLGAMLIAVAPASAAAAQPAVVTQPDEAAKLAEARAILAVMFPPGEREQMFTKLQADLVSQFSSLLPAAFMAHPGLKALFDDFKNAALTRQRAVLMKHLPLQLEAMAEAYSREFSLAELKDIHRFAQMPAGGHYLSKSLSIVGDPAVAKANSDAIAEIHTTTQALLPGFKEKVMAYLKEHPDVAEKLSAESKAN